MTPALSPEEEAHSRALTALIHERIGAAGGWIPFEQFMDLALYAPGLGYYRAGSVKLGPAGDFVTAPEVSDLFSRCVARQCAQVLGGGGGEILELGAGTGRMAAVVLETLAASGALPARYAILEVSADLAQRQRERVARLPRELGEKVVWLDRLPERPIDGVILANEVLDALPCRRFAVHAGAVRELGVSLEALPADMEGGAPTAAQQLVELDAAADSALAGACESLPSEVPAPLPDGYASELCLRVEPWIAGVADCLERGVMLLFDYGLPRAH